MRVLTNDDRHCQLLRLWLSVCQLHLVRSTQVGLRIGISPLFRQKVCVVENDDFRVHRSLSHAHVPSNGCNCSCESTEKRTKNKDTWCQKENFRRERQTCKHPFVGDQVCWQIPRPTCAKNSGRLNLSCSLVWREKVTCVSTAFLLPFLSLIISIHWRVGEIIVYTGWIGANMSRSVRMWVHSPWRKRDTHQCSWASYRRTSMSLFTGTTTS